MNTNKSPCKHEAIYELGMQRDARGLPIALLGNCAHCHSTVAIMPEYAFIGKDELERYVWKREGEKMAEDCRKCRRCKKLHAIYCLDCTADIANNELAVMKAKMLKIIEEHLAMQSSGDTAYFMLEDWHACKKRIEELK